MIPGSIFWNSAFSFSSIECVPSPKEATEKNEDGGGCGLELAGLIRQAVLSPKDVVVGYKQKWVTPSVPLANIASSDIVSDKNLTTSSEDNVMSLYLVSGMR